MLALVLISSFLTVAAITVPTSVALAAIILVIKSGLVALLTVRARVPEGAFLSQAEADNLMLPIFQPLILAYSCLPGIGLPFANRMERCAKNNAENEPLVILLALAVATPLARSSYGDLFEQLLTVFTFARVLHTLFFLMLPFCGPESRTIAYTFSLFSALALAGLAVVVVLL